VFGFAGEAGVLVWCRHGFLEDDDSAGLCRDGIDVVGFEFVQSASGFLDFLIGLGSFDGKDVPPHFCQRDGEFTQDIQRSDRSGRYEIELPTVSFILADGLSAVVDDGQVLQIQISLNLFEKTSLLPGSLDAGDVNVSHTYREWDRRQTATAPDVGNFLSIKRLDCGQEREAVKDVLGPRLIRVSNRGEVELFVFFEEKIEESAEAIEVVFLEDDSE